MTSTRYAELCYEQQAKNLWRIVASEDGSSIGPHYRTKAELLGDLDRYAAEYGCDGAPKQPLLNLNIFAWQASHFHSEDAPAEFVLCPCQGVEAHVTIEPAHDGWERIWDQVTINGKVCGNRHAGLKQFTQMVLKVNPRLMAYEPEDTLEFHLPPLSPE